MSFQQFKQELSTWLTSLGAGQVSKEFFELIKNIGEARSKQEESAIIVKESHQLKQALAQPIDNKVRSDSCHLFSYFQLLPTMGIRVVTVTPMPVW